MLLGVSIKSGSDQRANSKDDLSKANKLLEFYNKHEEAHIFIATFEIEFHDDMHISLANCYIMPLAWIPDVYVTPSNNGNMQSSKYKNLEAAIKRTTKEFIVELKKANQIAIKKRAKKQSYLLPFDKSPAYFCLELLWKFHLYNTDQKALSSF